MKLSLMKILVDQFIGSSSSSVLGNLGKVGNYVGTGILAATGSNILKNRLDSVSGKNSLGLPNQIFESIYSGVNSALKNAAGGLPKAVIGLLNAVVGGVNSAQTPLNLRLDGECKINCVTQYFSF
ncbi:MAG: hypothetical protein ACRCUJ_03170 [Phocaeicola sp.]